ncbi:fatty-acyl-CoA synthase [Shimia isoporae]|uniref:Fatty-acyl-CoA synthase n=1 Tax=Shimia isoporae TaxID=647720 RepID=A0A4R1N8N9_9RHOB|nr:acyl-CoA synthetase [Shimia isoporae]TCK99262.1 fatty-acyl-CoA synthase [Shimia isoporae]
MTELAKGETLFRQLQEAYDAKRALAETASWEETQPYHSIHEMVAAKAKQHPDQPAITFQLTSDPDDVGRTLTYGELYAQVTQCANLLRGLGVGPTDVIALVLPNCAETVVAMLGAMCVGIVNPINPLLEAEQVSGILRETKAKVVITLRSLPKTDIAQKCSDAVSHAPSVETVLEIDLAGYLSPIKRGIVGLIRPKNPNRHKAKVLRFAKELAKQNHAALDFEDAREDRYAAYFHTGGTTGTPKVAQHKVSAIIYQGWMFSEGMVDTQDVIMCPLPLFHVMAGHVVLGQCLQGGAHLILPTPQGFRGDGVFDNYWKLVERHKATVSIIVPTAAAALMQRPVDADVSTLRLATSGSAPMPMDLFRQFNEATGLSVMEGYGMTENTCMASITPPGVADKVGSVGIPVPFADVKVLDITQDGVERECGVDEIGEICVHSPGVNVGATYIEAEKNAGLYAAEKYLRTGDLGRKDADGYIWITGRAKDLIIRGGHNIDPAVIEEALMAHHDVSFVAAVGQPDEKSGELPCAYVELVEGPSRTSEELLSFAKQHISERAAAPKYLEIVSEMPLTLVGKVFKPELRKRAIKRVFNQVLENAGLEQRVAEVVDDKKRGMVAQVVPKVDGDETKVDNCLKGFIPTWEWGS